MKIKSMRKVTIFLGPTLSINEAKKYISNVDFKSPAKRGDIENEILIGTDIIGLVDGMFHEYSAVGHKEILNGLRKGIKIIGASSMGALRAYEMSKYGMIGIGKVYQLYKNHVIDSDDEVAVLCDPYSYSQITESLVDIKETLEKAFRHNIITKENKKELIKIAKLTHYKNRTYEYIFSKFKERTNNINSYLKIEDWISHNKISIKKMDCINLLEYIKKIR